MITINDQIMSVPVKVEVAVVEHLGIAVGKVTYLDKITGEDLYFNVHTLVLDRDRFETAKSESR